MRSRTPSIRIDGPVVTVRTELVADDGTDLPPLEVRLPVDHIDLLDPTATPALPVLAALAAIRGEDLLVEGPADAAMVAGATRAAAVQARWWGTDPVSIEAPDTYEGTPGGDGVGLFFTRGVDSWSTLIDLLAEPPGDRVTHLVAVHHGSDVHRPIEAQIFHGHQRVADELGLTLVVLSTTARTLLDPLRTWATVSASALVSTGLVASAGLARLVLASAVSDVAPDYQLGDHPEVLGPLTTGRTDVVLGNQARPRPDRVAHLREHPLARSTLQVCWEGMTPGNCGRCAKCQSTMATLILAGDPDPGAGFDGEPDPAVVRGLDLPDFNGETVARLVADLPPEHEELRRAWSDAWDRSRGAGATPRWGDGDVPGLAGPGVPRRVATALRAATGHPDAPAIRPLGWQTGTVPLRPALDDHPRIRSLATTGPGRSQPWAVVEHHIRADVQDGQQAALALRCLDTHGPGLVYLPGILWAPTQPPALGPDAVERILGTARARLWWRPSGDLEPLRVVETIEQGCLPLQVMPAGAADDLRADLPAALAPLVVADDELGRIDLSPEAVSARLGPALDLLLAGAAEHDLAGVLHG